MLYTEPMDANPQTMIANREELFERVRALHPEAVDLLARAIDYAVQAHDSQMRVSGEPYVDHEAQVIGWFLKD